MDAAVKQLSAEGYEVQPEDIARLSPLGHKHVNMLGRYTFTLPDTVARGELRPLRDPRTAGVDEARTSLCRFSVPLLLKPLILLTCC